CSSRGTNSIVFVHCRDPEHGQHQIADESLDGTAKASENWRGGLDATAQHAPSDFRIQGALDRRHAEITNQCGDSSAGLAMRARGRDRRPSCWHTAPRGLQEHFATWPCEAEGVGEQHGGVLAGSPVYPALQVTNPALAHVRGFSKLVL